MTRIAQAYLSIPFAISLKGRRYSKSCSLRIYLFYQKYHLSLSLPLPRSTSSLPLSIAGGRPAPPHGHHRKPQIQQALEHQQLGTDISLLSHVLAFTIIQKCRLLKRRTPSHTWTSLIEQHDIWSKDSWRMELSRVGMSPGICLGQRRDHCEIHEVECARWQFVSIKRPQYPSRSTISGRFVFCISPFLCTRILLRIWPIAIICGSE